MPHPKPIDEALLTAMWQRGASYRTIGRAINLVDKQVPVRAAKLGLPARTKPERVEPKPRVRVKMVRTISKPVADPKPVAEPQYHPGLSDAIQRAKAASNPIKRLGDVATSYRVKYREVLAMAGVQA